MRGWRRRGLRLLPPSRLVVVNVGPLKVSHSILSAECQELHRLASISPDLHDCALAKNHTSQWISGITAMFVHVNCALITDTMTLDPIDKGLLDLCKRYDLMMQCADYP